MCGLPDWEQRWQRYMKHRSATVRDWDNREALRWTGQPGGRAQYNPHLFGCDESVRWIELACISGGVPLAKSDKKMTFYMRHPDDQIVGACCGQETQYVYVEWLCSGEIHGRPMSTSELQRRGAVL